MSRSHFHFMGIGGQGISAVAQMTHLAGHTVTGCDQSLSATVKALQQAGIAIAIGHNPDHLVNVDTLVISPAVPALDPHNPELVAAQQRDVRVVTWQEMLGSLMKGKCVLSVAGVHGKSTTTSLLSLLLIDAGLDPTCIIGAVVPRLGTNYHLGQSQYVVNEADEFNHNFWHYHPRLAIIKSIEFEHPEFFADYEACMHAFEQFVRGMDMDGDWPFPPTLLLNIDNAGCLDLRQRLHDWPGRILTFSVKEEGTANQINNRSTEVADFEAYDIQLDGQTSFRLKTKIASFPDQRPIHLRVPGVHNIENVLAALGAALCLGIPAQTLIETVESFGGTRRRFDIQYEGPLALVGGDRDVMLVDDYAHHPTAIAATLQAARRRYPDRRLIAVYQPHMYSRTRTFFNQFLEAFDEADIAVLVDIFPARERDTGLIHSRELVAAIAQRPHFTNGRAQVYHGGSIAETVTLLTEILRSGDLVLLMGAGDIYTVTEQLKQYAQKA